MRIMTRPWSISLLILLALLIIPATRDTLRDQLGLLSPLSPYYAFWPSRNFDGNQAQKLRENLVARAQEANPRDWQITLGVGLLTFDPDKKSAWVETASKLAPREPAPLAAFLNSQVRELSYRRDEDWGYGQTLPPGREEELLTPQQAQPAAAALEAWQGLEPDNAAPKALLAWLYFGEKKDAAGMEQLQAAARSPRLDFHTSDMLKAQIRTLQAGGLTDFDAATAGSASLLFPQLAGLRSIARVAVYKGYAAQAAGQSQEALADWLAVIHFGRLMRYQDKTIIGYLVGTAIEAIGTAPIYKWSRRNFAQANNLTPAYPLTGRTGRYNNGDIYQGKSHNYFLKYAGPAETSDILAHLEQAHAAKLLLGNDSQADIDNWMRSLVMLRPGLVMLLGIGVLLALASLAGILTRGKKDRLPALRLPWAIVVSLLALLPVGIFALTISQHGPKDFYYYFARLVPLGANFSQWYASHGLSRLDPFALHFTPAILLLFWLLPAGLGVWLKGKRAASFPLTYIGLVRRAVPVCLLLLILGYGVLTGWNTSLRARVISHIESTIIQGEMAPLRLAHPELFQPPAAETASPRH
jgi:hypothetical protein